LNGPNYGGCHFRTIFVLGSWLEADDFEQELAEENVKYGDLLVGQFFDHYNNATLKVELIQFLNREIYFIYRNKYK